MPTRSRAPNTSCVCAAVLVTLSPSASPWSAKASRVFSGIVFTVSATTCSVMYMGRWPIYAASVVDQARVRALFALPLQ